MVSLLFLNDVVWWGFDRKYHRYLLVLLWMFHFFCRTDWNCIKCIRQINKKYFHFLSNFGILGVCLTEIMHNIDGIERRHYTTLNIHIILMECIMEFKFGTMMHYYRFHSFVYSMTPYDLDLNLQGHWYCV